MWLQNPSSVLLLAPGEDHPAIPYVRRVPRAEYWRACGRQSGYNKRMNAGLVAPVEYMRLDPHSPHVLSIKHDWRGARFAVASPVLAIGLLLTQRESDWIERDMRQLFVDRDDADQAAAIAIRSFERWAERRGN
jgi:hypothetical protein